MTCLHLKQFELYILRGARREAWLSLCVIAFCIAATNAAFATERPEFDTTSKSRPNIVLIMADDI